MDKAMEIACSDIVQFQRSLLQRLIDGISEGIVQNRDHNSFSLFYFLKSTSSKNPLHTTRSEEIPSKKNSKHVQAS